MPPVAIRFGNHPEVQSQYKARNVSLTMGDYLQAVEANSKARHDEFQYSANLPKSQKLMKGPFETAKQLETGLSETNRSLAYLAAIVKQLATAQEMLSTKIPPL